jgi:hypothetical protein
MMSADPHFLNFLYLKKYSMESHSKNILKNRKNIHQQKHIENAEKKRSRESAA